MKRILVPAIILLLILAFSFAAGEEAGMFFSHEGPEGTDRADETATGPLYAPDDSAILEIVRSAAEFAGDGDACRVKEYIDHETYAEVILACGDPDGASDAAATVLADKSTGRVIYYRRADCRMPEFPNENELFGTDGGSEAAGAWRDMKKAWLDWGKQAFAKLTGDDPGGYFCDFLHCRDENLVLFAFCNDKHGDLHAAMVCALPDAERPEPLLTAYADVETNPSVGYDGCLTAEQAADTGVKAITEAFPDAAGFLVPDCISMIIYDALLYVLDVETEEIEPDDFENADAYWAYIHEKQDVCSPMWIIRMTDLRNELPDAETGHEYWAFVNALTGNLAVPPTVTEYEIGW